MPIPAVEPDLENAYRCVEHVLQGISQSAGYYSDGAVVAREKDVRGLRLDRQAEYDEKMLALSIMHVNRTHDPSYSVGGIDAWKVTFNILGLTTLTRVEDQTDAGAGATHPLLLTQKLFRIENDIRTVIGKNRQMVAASSALLVPRPNVTDWRVVNFLHAADVPWPDAAFAAVCQFILKERAAFN